MNTDTITGYSQTFSPTSTTWLNAADDRAGAVRPLQRDSSTSRSIAHYWLAGRPSGRPLRFSTGNPQTALFPSIP